MMNIQLRTSNSKLDLGAGDEVRTRDIQLGKLTLYQLSYARTGCMRNIWYRNSSCNMRRERFNND